MITKVSIIGKMEGMETRTASISVKGRMFDNRAVKQLLEKDRLYIEPVAAQLLSLKVCLEMRKSQWTRPLKVRLLIEDVNSLDEKLEAIGAVLTGVSYEMTIGKFKDCGY